MAIEKLCVPEPLELGKLHQVLQSPGPCITLVLPPYHPGERAQSGAALLKASLQSLTRQFTERGFAKATEGDLLEPLEHLTSDWAWPAGSHLGCAILRSPDVFCQIRLTQPAKPSLTVAGCFAVRRLLDEFYVPRLFYILALSKESVSLFRCLDMKVDAVELPERIPMTLREALEFEPPDHDLENRSTAGSDGAMGRIRFGTGSGRETAHTHLADFYKLVDRGIHLLLRESEIPLLLAGVGEDIAAYRSASAYRWLAKESLRGSPNLSSQEAQTVILARSLLRAEEQHRQAEALKEMMERTAPDRLLSDPPTIVNAAFDGRVRHLFVDESAEIGDVFERRTYRTWGKEDLLNLAVVETMLHRGKAVELPRNMMPEGAAAVAALRY
jgi:hypothetical protein